MVGSRFGIAHELFEAGRVVTIMVIEDFSLFVVRNVVSSLWLLSTIHETMWFQLEVHMIELGFALTANNSCF